MSRCAIEPEAPFRHLNQNPFIKKSPERLDRSGFFLGEAW
jgi:hypothetical protein